MKTCKRNIENKYTIVGIIVSIIMLIFPFILKIKLYPEYVLPDGYVFRDYTNIYTYYKQYWILCTFLICTIIGLYTYKKIRAIYNSYLLVVTAAMIMIIAVFSTIFSEYQSIALQGFVTENYGVLSYISIYGLLIVLIYIIYNSDIDLIVWAILLSSSLVCILGIFQYLGIDYFGAEWFAKLVQPSILKGKGIAQLTPTTHPFWFDASSTIFQPNYFGAYASILLPISLGFTFSRTHIVERVIGLIMAILLFIGVLLSGSMGGWGAGLIALMVMGLFFFRRNVWEFSIFIAAALLSIYIPYRINGAKYWYDPIIAIIKSRGMFMIGSIVGAVIVYILCKKVLFKYRKWTFIITVSIVLVSCIGMFLHAVNNPTEQFKRWGNSRGYIWIKSYELIKEKPILGHGPDTFYAAFPQDDFERNIYIGEDIELDKAHSMYLQIAIDLGIPALLAFLGLFIAYFYNGITSYKGVIERKEEIYTITFMIAIGAYLIQGIVNNNIIVIQPIVFILLALGIVNNTALKKIV